MIVVSHNDGEIKIEGHAEYAPEGQDIVCAGVSALTQSLIASVDALTYDKLICDISAGNVVIQYGNLSERGKVLLDSFLIGVAMTADAYPEYVRINYFESECRGHKDATGAERIQNEI